MNKLTRLVEQHFTGTYLCSLRVRCTILLFLPKSDIFQIRCCYFCTVIWNLLWESKKGNLIQSNGVVVSNSAKDFMPHPNLQETSEVHWYMLHHNNSDSQKSDFGLESVLELVMDSCCYVWSLLPCSSCPQDWCGQTAELGLHMAQDTLHAGFDLLRGYTSQLIFQIVLLPQGITEWKRGSYKSWLQGSVVTTRLQMGRVRSWEEHESLFLLAANNPPGGKEMAHQKKSSGFLLLSFSPKVSFDKITQKWCRYNVFWEFLK